MIEYDGRAWLPILIRMRGSVIPRLIPRVLMTAALGVVAVLVLRRSDFKLPGNAHTLVGVALGLLLVFRTNASYDRYWEGRRLLGAITNRARDLARQIGAYIEDAEARAALCRLIPAFYWVAAQTLRKEASLGNAERLLTPDEQAAMSGVTFRAPLVTQWISTRLRAEAAAGRLSEARLQVFDGNLTALNDALGGAERILRTPIPFAYAQHIKIFVVLFCFSAPFVLAEVMGWATPAACGLLALALFGIDEIGVEIEDPFGDDPNDLPLDAIGNGIEKAVTEIATR
ncbi:MAG TPA: bestrophin family ion channel [Kofleriaceae bacterium]|nr:bestrophin family ion channel [Kofleriaceae bacterium]